MRLPIILSALLLGAAGLGVAACGSSDNGSGSSTAAGVVSVATIDGTDVLADSAGKTLYSAAVEKGGKIRCVGACTTFWQPMLTSKAAAEKAAGNLDAQLGVVTRPGGQQQLTFDGLPLYTFAEEGTGKLQGDGFADQFQGTHFQWMAARTSGGSGAPTDSRTGY
jgi:predicted lipoprotein with Yx(FWY)xxD motif